MGELLASFNWRSNSSICSTFRIVNLVPGILPTSVFFRLAALARTQSFFLCGTEGHQPPWYNLTYRPFPAL